MTTKHIFRGLLDHLRAEVEPLGLASRFLRYDGDALFAIEEHAAYAAAGDSASVLVGFTALQSVENAAGGRMVSGVLPVTVLAVRHRHGETPQESAEALDDLADALASALAIAPGALKNSGIANVTHTATAGLTGSPDWHGRALTVSVYPISADALVLTN